MNAMTAEFNDATGELQEEFAGIAKDLQRELTATQADLRSQLDLTSLFADDAAEAASPAFQPPDARAEAAPDGCGADVRRQGHRVFSSGTAGVMSRSSRSCRL